MKQTSDEDRNLERGNYIIPCLLHSVEFSVPIKSVLLDISGRGCRVFTNDKRIRRLEQRFLKGMRFRVEFDFYDIDTSGISGEVVNVLAGRNPQYERQLGIHFTTIRPVVVRDINRHVVSGINHSV